MEKNMDELDKIIWQFLNDNQNEITTGFVLLTFSMDGKKAVKGFGHIEQFNCRACGVDHRNIVGLLQEAIDGIPEINRNPKSSKRGRRLDIKD